MASQQPYREEVLDLPGRSPIPPQLHDHHQASFEGVINYDQLPPLAGVERSRAQDVLYRVVRRVGDEVGIKEGYHRNLLILHSYEFSASDISKDIFLRVFFNFMGFDIDSDADIDTDDSRLTDKLKGFADMLLDQFFIPLKANGKRTPQPTPDQISAIKSIQSPHEIIGTVERVSYLRSLCLIRDRHRCVVSRVFDMQEERRRLREQGPVVMDDDGNVIKVEDPRDFLEVAHILPHSLVKVDKDLQLNDARRTAINILNMFDCDVASLIEGPYIDSPRNAISLTHAFHNIFGNFEIYFEAVSGEENTYRIESIDTPGYAERLGLPVTRKLFLSDGKTIDPPSPRLLALHRAIAKILSLSGAGEYIDKLFRDLEETGVQEDGSTDLGRLITFRLGGGQDYIVQAY
ncbi:TPA_exp: Uncharacterized protein A8136_3347 [Trichophyton benhamiae CBS 112371]|uniref:HNH nuclease domain-containing protein n=1 Tax=Arthroderma benhamiae (strain ATCC MYA-4681 / CBS 112371) TaxID=663331 RepID=D4B053_ARTBC|nr:uncharacterized protein ARB_01824 [Trichophyton benhamiae CBS 112371]EFE31205.1 conserved hypothetical protein [Trichophyton benhamiae CBS 112371]DAA74380.1 TPA_exp: Uncharacterized protein A8136_3347 [Trichophyton benhamiae CBS 112371]